MTALTRYLFSAPAERRPGAIFRWWERRRLFYNVVVGAAGSVSLLSVPLIFRLPPDSFGMGFLWAPALAVGVLANVCYFFGPATELAVEKLFRGQVLPTGPVLFRMGLTFSAGLVLLPTLVALIAWVARIVMSMV